MLETDIYCKVSGMVVECCRTSFLEKKVRPLVIEIGCAEGQGTMRFAPFARKVICIDPMVSGRPDIVSKNLELMPVDREKIETFNTLVRHINTPIGLVIGCSLWPETIAEVKKAIDKEEADILVIDGCHHPFEAVWADFEAYSPFVRSGGYVIFDDTYEECIEQCVQKAISELGYVLVERYSRVEPGMLQEVVTLRKP